MDIYWSNYEYKIKFKCKNNSDLLVLHFPALYQAKAIKETREAFKY